MRRGMVFALLAALAVGFISAQKKKDEVEEAWTKTAPAADNRIFEQILEYRKKGDFERAIAVAVEPVNGKLPDDFLLQATAVTYFQRAQADQINREKWIDLAVHYSERAFQANPGDLVNLFNLGDSYMAAGMNLGEPQACPYYQKSLEAFERLKAEPSLQGEWGTIEGERVQLAQYRQKLDEHLKNLRALAIKC